MFQGKTALVTGAGSEKGIGFGVARALAARKCKVILHDMREEEEVKPLLEKLTSEFQIEAEYVQFDFMNLGGLEEFCSSLLSKHGRIDILINNAGILNGGVVTEFPLEQWQEMVNVMLTAPLLLTKHLLPPMKAAGWGRIVSIGSVMSQIGVAAMSCYTTVKHGMAGFTKAIALEAAGTGVTSNVICPGAVRTEILERFVRQTQQDLGSSFDEALKIVVDNYHPSKQLVTTEQVGETAAFLCSPAADQITGTSITVDGGCVAR